MMMIMMIMWTVQDYNDDDGSPRPPESETEKRCLSPYRVVHGARNYRLAFGYQQFIIKINIPV